MNSTDWIGSIGVAILLVAFFLNLSQKLKNDSITYTLLNLIGAALAGLASVLLNYWPFIILESAWVAVSAHALWKTIKK